MKDLSFFYPRIERLIKSASNFIQHVFVRIGHDRLAVTAGYLAYITLLSLVPLITVLFTMLASIPEFAGMGNEIQKFIITNFVPTAGNVIETYLNEFIANTGKMTAVGLGSLFVIALMLISNIDNTFNYIWRVKKKRRFAYSFSIYWMILTLGPILTVASVAASSYVLSLEILNTETISGITNRLVRLIPMIISVLSFAGLYAFVPNKKVKWFYAVIGGFLSALLFEGAKKIFALYIASFPSYQVIYGALAAIPILFVWVYLSWCIVLLGAEVTVSLGELEEVNDSIDTESV